MTQTEIGALVAGIAIGLVAMLYILMFVQKIQDRKHERRRQIDIEYKRERLRPSPRPTQSVDALAEVGRPVSHQSKARMFPRAGRKRS